MAKRFPWNLGKKKTKTIEAASAEGERDRIDPLTGQRTANTTRQIRKNNFGTYSKQVYQIRDNYNAVTDYGASMTKSIIDMRVAFICGGDISVSAGPGQKWVDKFLKDNNLNGSGLIDIVELAEKEGKNLFIIRREGTGADAPIKYKLIPWTEIEYDVIFDQYRDPVKVEIKGKESDSEKIIKQRTYIQDEFEYIYYGGCLDDINISPPRIASCLTQIENYERALYDLRENNHYFGRTTPLIQTKDARDANYVQQKINDTDWTIGKYLVGPLNGKMLSPGIEALEAIKGEMALNAKVISTVTGLPVHWIGWTDLMSNRATAETLDEIIKFATKKERLKLVEGLKRVIYKAAAKARAGGQTVPEFEVEIELPNITSADLKALMEVYYPLWVDKIISTQFLRGLIPDIDPDQEKKQIEKEQKEENEKNEQMKPAAAKEFEDFTQGEDEE